MSEKKISQETLDWAEQEAKRIAAFKKNPDWEQDLRPARDVIKPKEEKVMEDNMERFQNERDYFAWGKPATHTTVAAMDWAKAEIERLQEKLTNRETLREMQDAEIERLRVEIEALKRPWYPGPGEEK